MLTRRTLLSLPLLAPLARAVGVRPEPCKMLVYVKWGYVHDGLVAAHSQASGSPVTFDPEPTFIWPFQRQSAYQVGCEIAQGCGPLRPSAVLLAFERDAFHRYEDGPTIAERITQAASEHCPDIAFTAVYQ